MGKQNQPTPQPEPNPEPLSPSPSPESHAPAPKTSDPTNIARRSRTSKSLGEHLTPEQRAIVANAQAAINALRQAQDATPTTGPASASNKPAGPLAAGLQSFIAEVNERRMMRTKRDAEALARRRAAFRGDCSWCLDGELDDGVCDRCERGRAVRSERQRDAADRAAQHHRDARRDLLVGSGMPERRWQQSLDTYPRPDLPAFHELVTFLDRWDGRRGLMLTGSYGTGKTGLLVGALREIADRYVDTTHRMQFATAPDLMDMLRAGYDDDTFAERVDRVRWVRLLAIDDLGSERPTEWVIERLFTIINHRYEHDLPIFVTTNYGRDELAARIGERLVDRLIESCQVIAVRGPNLRHAGAGGSGSR